MATMLATLDFNLAKDADGNDITFEATFVNGAIEYVQLVAIDFWFLIEPISAALITSLVDSNLEHISAKKHLVVFSQSEFRVAKLCGGAGLVS